MLIRVMRLLPEPLASLMRTRRSFPPLKPHVTLPEHLPPLESHLCTVDFARSSLIIVVAVLEIVGNDVALLVAFCDAPLASAPLFWNSSLDEYFLLFFSPAIYFRFRLSRCIWLHNEKTLVAILKLVATLVVVAVRQ